MKNNLQETIVALVLVVLLSLILNPYDFWMPDMAHMSALGLLLVVFIAYAAFSLREEVTDERDMLHRMFAGRAAFITGTTILTLGVLLGALHGTLDKWLVFTLVGMIIAKLAARLYTDRNL